MAPALGQPNTDTAKAQQYPPPPLSVCVGVCVFVHYITRTFWELLTDDVHETSTRTIILIAR